ncbi:Spc98p NDAI_0F02850 [Naumovozyma dairenensis CBS 421]|uniref:Spindle pole body component n=1 Tax=Naumovozyma dairenensis (strain ATCC 10597 / BCRC 20456 / CBS 421 / NBRC 0211 / NRRL Y-12639) TaxID=1071378 RepID=G0WCU2_NAUDC|nr:hypothetical protein NDAI_0F02850 [Naumovozyma dairenensis CBS 421]CCD25603.1 hypothetical protein NDAI_0F02850 [Naumovozyma dairenensis CBS 421]
MDLEASLSPILEVLVPPTLSDLALRSLIKELSFFLKSSSRSNAHLQSILQVYSSQTPGNEENIACWERLENLLKPLCTIRNIDEIIKYLSVFQSLVFQNLNSSPTSRHQRGNSFQIPTMGHNNYNNNISMTSPQQYDPNVSMNSPTRPQSLYAESFENLDRFSDRRSLPSIYRGYQQQQNRHINQSNNLNNGPLVSLKTLSDQYYRSMLPEEDILRYASYTLLATTSHMFPMDYNSIQIPSNIPNSISALLHLIFEAGLLYQNLNAMVNNYNMKDVSPIKKSLLLQLNKELQIYTGFINNLITSNACNSLKSLYMELFDSISTLRIYFKFMNQFDITLGDAFLSTFHSWRSHGDLLVRKIATQLFDCTLSIYIDYLGNWLVFERLENNYNEFFIIKNTDTQKTPLDSYKLIHEKIPYFIPKDVAKKIFIIGKTYSFLIDFCKDLQFSNNLSKKYTIIYKNIFEHYNSESYNTVLNKLFESIENQYNEIVKYTNLLLCHKFHYHKMILTLKNLLLMGRSDFLDLLANKAVDILNPPSVSIQEYKLTNCLQEAVQYSSIASLYLNKEDNNFIINGLDARVLDMGHGSIGWDIFTLDYNISPPLSLIINVNRENGKKEYLRIFNFLWRSKKNSFFYNNEMLRTTHILKMFKRLKLTNPLIKDVTKKIAKLGILRSRLQNFNLCLESFCQYYIVEKEFQILLQKLNISDEGSNPIQINKKLKTKNTRLIETSSIPILKPKKSIFADDHTSTSTYGHDAGFDGDHLNIEQLEEIHNNFLSNIRSHKLLIANSTTNIGTYSKKAYPITLIIILETLFQFINSYSQLNDISEKLLIQFNLLDPVDLNNLLTEFSKSSIEVTRYYKVFLNQSHVFERDLKADNDEELIKLGRQIR